MKRIILPEVVATGIYNTEIAMKNREITKKRKTTMFELELAIGSGGVSYIDGESRVIEDGLVICAKPGQTRHTRLPFMCRYIHAIVPEGGLRDILLELPTYLPTKDSAPFLSLFERIEGLYAVGSKEDSLMMHSAILELIYHIKKEAARTADYHRVSGESGYVERAIEYIKENLTEELSLSKVAARVSLSPVHFHNCFKSATGRTLRDYVEHLRISRAVDLLVSTDYTLTKIAFECGFSSQSYFSYAFRRRMKKTPREYAKELQRKYEK